MYGIFTNIGPKNRPNVGKYTIHGAYGIPQDPYDSPPGAVRQVVPPNWIFSDTHDSTLVGGQDVRVRCVEKRHIKHE